ncbi:MAG: phosphatase PAP2 family protein [Gemmatimonadota bacterium]
MALTIPVDRAVLGYAAAVVIISLCRAAENHGNLYVAAAHLGLFPLIWLVRREPVGPVGRLLGEIYPILLLVGLYSALDVINATKIGTTYDDVVRGWERGLFGGEPARDWWRSAPSQFWSTILHAAYFSFYLIVPIPLVAFGFRRRLPELRRSVLILFVTFAICYLTFMVFPVAGPYYEYPRPTGTFVDNGPARLVYATLAGGSSYGAAFPSSHVAGTVAAAAAAWLGDRRLGALLAVPVVLTLVGVVYCQMHYAVDAIAGTVVAVSVAIALRNAA